MKLANVNIHASLIDDDVDVIAQEAAAEMLSRLDFMMLKPQHVLAFGRGLPAIKQHLSNRYPDANHNDDFIAASQDLIVANLVLPHMRDIPLFLSECLTLLRPHGLLMFTAFGLDTLHEYQHLFAANTLPLLVDMHDVGDALLKMGWCDVVVDVNYYTLSYKQQATLFAELKATKMMNVSSEALPAYIAQAANVQAIEGRWPLTYEIIHAHGFAPDKTPQQMNKDGSVEVPLAALKMKKE